MKVQLSPFLRDVVVTTLTAAMGVVAIIAVTRLLAEGLGTEGFGAYSLSRRVLSLLDPLASLAMGVAIPRYLAMARTEQSRVTYLRAGTLLGVVPALLLLALGLFFRDYFAGLVFKSVTYVPLLVATMLLVVAYCSYTLTYGYYRGVGRMDLANLWQLVTGSLLPIVIALVWGRSGRPDLIIRLMALAFAINAVPLVIHLFGPGSAIDPAAVRELWGYGLPRVPASLALTGIFTVGPFLAGQFGSLDDVGYFVVAQSGFRVLEGAVVAFGMVALPRATQIIAEGKHDYLRRGIGDIVAFVVHIGLFATLHLALWYRQVLLVWLGPQYGVAVPAMQVLGLALVPYIAYVMLRSIVDAGEVLAVNTINLVGAFILAALTCLVLGMLGTGLVGLGAGTSAGIFLLGGFTLRHLHRRYPIDRSVLRLAPMLALNGLLVGLAFAGRQLLTSRLEGTALLASGGVMEAILFVAYCTGLAMMGCSWVTTLRHRMLPQHE